MSRHGQEFPSPYGRDIPWPSDRNGAPQYLEITERLYVLWKDLFKTNAPFEERQRRIDEFFSEHKENGVSEWLEDRDPTWRKPRGSLIRDKALQDLQREESRRRQGMVKDRKGV